MSIDSSQKFFWIQITWLKIHRIEKTQVKKKKDSNKENEAF